MGAPLPMVSVRRGAARRGGAGGWATCAGDADSVPAGAAGDERGGARPPACAVVPSSVPAFPGLARPVATAALALWPQSWAVHSITKRRPRVPGAGSFCIPIGRRDNPYAAQPGRRLVIEWTAQILRPRCLRGHWHRPRRPGKAGTGRKDRPPGPGTDAPHTRPRPRTGHGNSDGMEWRPARPTPAPASAARRVRLAGRTRIAPSGRARRP